MNKYLGLLVIPLLVGLYFLLNTHIDTEIENRTINNEIEVEETINNAVKETKDANPTDDPNTALDSLREAIRNWD